jgi:prolyl oligopeptidase
VGGKLYVNRLKDVKTETTVYTLDGKPAGKIDSTESARLRCLGRTTDRYGYFSFESFIMPPTIYRLDTTPASAKSFSSRRFPSIPASMS